MGYQVEQVTLAPMRGLGIREQLPLSELPAFFGRAFGELGQIIQGAGASIAGAPFARYFSVSPERVDVELIFPTNIPVAASGRAKSVELPGGLAARTRHVGPYDQMAPAYAAVNEWLAAHAKKPTDAPHEVYLSDPGSVPNPADWVTLIEQPFA